MVICLVCCILPSWCRCQSLSLAPVNPDWFYLPGFYLFLVPAYPDSPGQNPESRKMVVVVVDIIWKVHTACDLNFIVKDGLLRVTGSHVHSRSGNLSETVLDL